MSRKRTIVGIGEALLAELPERNEPAGLAPLVALSAARLGHAALVISRLGQDAAGDELIRQLQDAHVDITHLQHDPDYSTARLIVRRIGPTAKRSLDKWAAFDNLQWDFDLDDVAQQADAVVFGTLAQRSNQTWSTIQRFLSGCSGALRLLDLTNRAEDEFNRVQAISAIQYADSLLLDDAALAEILPAAQDAEPRDAAVQVIRQHDVAMVVVLSRDGRMTVHTSDACEAAAASIDTDATGAREAAMVGLLHGMLAAWDFPRSLELAGKLGQHAAKRPGEPVPDDWLS